MADKRMFSKAIIDSDAFIDMPVTSRLLYYDLGMRADDDGFVNAPKKIMRTVGASEDDLRILITRKFIIPFENGIVVIKHWNINNYIRKDTYKETTYTDEKKLLGMDENRAYFLKENGPVTDPLRVRDETVTDPSRRLDKIRLDKIRLEQYREEEGSPPQLPETFGSLAEPPAAEIIAAWNAQGCTKKINELRPMTKRYDETKLCFRHASPEEFIQVIRSLDEQAFFVKRARQKDPLRYDWFCRPDNFLKVLEGNYREEFKEEKAGKYDSWEVV